MAMVNIPMKLNTKSGRDPSFSSYLNGAEETFVLNLDPSRDYNNKADDGEIDVFSAEKYFNEGIDQENAIKGEPQNKYKIEEPVKQKIRPLTPSIHSESSWNSRSALLQNFSRNHQQKSNNKSYGKKILATLGCNCYCNDKNSVQVDNQAGEKIQPKAKHNRSFEFSTTGANHQEVHFKKIDELGFPVFDPKAGNPGVKIQLQQEEESRKSLEVFGLEKERRKPSLEKKLSMLTWDAIASQPDEIDMINVGGSCNGTYEDDYAESDASSDLFEIESFPSNVTLTANPSLVRQVSDGMSSYAPSEVSIDWSVVTASAADFSIMSDSEDLKLTRNSSVRKEKPRRRSGTFLGCNSLKAVGVVGDAVKVSERTSMEMPNRNLKNDSIMPMTRFHTESKLKSTADAGKRPHHFTTRSFSSSYSERPADFLYI